MLPFFRKHPSRPKNFQRKWINFFLTSTTSISTRGSISTTKSGWSRCRRWVHHFCSQSCFLSGLGLDCILMIVLLLLFYQSKLFLYLPFHFVFISAKKRSCILRIPSRLAQQRLICPSKDVVRERKRPYVSIKPRVGRRLSWEQEIIGIFASSSIVSGSAAWSE